VKLFEYVKRRNGVPIGNAKSLQYNLQRSIGAKNFSTFWNFWNPIFGYYLGVNVFKPLKRIFPTTISLILTFIFCGMIHDFVTILFRDDLSLFFSVWFLFMGITVVVTKYINYDLSEKKWIYRAITNVLIIGFCLLITILLNGFVKFY